MVSVSVPIWLTLTRIELAMPSAMPWARRFSLVTNRSSPTSWMLVAEHVGQRLPPGHVVLGHAVLDRGDRIVGGELGEDSRPFSSGVRLRPSPVIS